MENKRGWTKVNNFAELREKLMPDPEKIVHNFLTDLPPRKPSRVPKPEPVSKVSKPSGVVPEHASVVPNNEPKTRKGQGKPKKKKKTKPPKHNKRPNLGEVARGRGLYRQIRAVERKIAVENAYYERAKRENRFYDGVVLRRLKSEREALVSEYVKLRDPLGLLPPLAPSSRKRKGKSNKPKKNAPEAPHEIVEEAKNTPAGASVRGEVVVKSKKKAKAKGRGTLVAEPRAAFTEKPEPMNTYDPRRELEIWEKPRGAKRGKYIPPGT
jgi:hypothetical protein